MKIFHNYKFYLILAYIVIIILNNVLMYFGIYITEEEIQNAVSYILSALIAYDVITINNIETKTSDEIKKDIQNLKNDVEQNTPKTKHKNSKNLDK